MGFPHTIQRCDGPDQRQGRLQRPPVSPITMRGSRGAPNASDCAARTPLRWQVTPVRRAATARAGWRRREHPHAHTFDMHGPPPPCTASGRLGRRCGEPSRWRTRPVASSAWVAARKGVRASSGVAAHEAAGELRADNGRFRGSEAPMVLQ
ncbi:hypothetical protein PVAP13_9KG369104 [Panicum virgatum]|uniref:Uncharacterized protein n=1 Tax=Panicum virgatum TaxID=38727 RepID=A0A8T0NM83_PANVG|nr:hypothetical protein PVAP13_9KG369104 [Panicum virgatum]